MDCWFIFFLFFSAGLFGNYDVPQVKKKVASKRKVAMNGNFTVPDQISKKSRGGEERTQTDHRVEKMFEKIIELDRVNFFELVINPDSFSESVENIFDVSFLVRRDRVAVIYDEREDMMYLGNLFNIFLKKKRKEQILNH